MKIKNQNSLGMGCHVCNTGIIISDTDAGEMVCSNCGFVHMEKTEDPNPERVIASESFKDMRTGPPLSLAKYDNGLATIIGATGRDAFGRPLSISMKYTIERLRLWDNRSRTHTAHSKNFRKAFTLLDQLKDTLGLSNAVVEESAYIYRKAVDGGIVRGRTISGVLAASVYAACRHTETPRSLNEISRGIDLNRKIIAKCYRLILTKLDLNMPVMDPMKYVAKITSKISINEKTKRDALKIIKHAADVGIVVGKDPNGFAASALYLSCTINGVKTTQKDIARAAGITEVTLRNRYKGLKLMA